MGGLDCDTREPPFLKRLTAFFRVCGFEIATRRKVFLSNLFAFREKPVQATDVLPTTTDDRNGTVSKSAHGRA